MDEPILEEPTGSKQEIEHIQEPPDKPMKKKKWYQSKKLDEIELDIKEDIEDFEKDFPEFDGWESIGFHRSLGKELWQIIIELITTSLGLVALNFYMPLLLPFPEIGGYQNVAGGLFTLVYTIFDLGTNFGLDRFVAEYRVKDTRRMMQYVSYVFWYQSFTGLIQVTLLSWYVFEVIVHNNFAFLAWIMLLQLVKVQYPGCLGIFRGVLSGMQHFNKVETLNIIQGQIVERFTLIGIVIAFRLWGENQISYGLMMGIIFGSIIGGHIDDVIFTFIGIYFLKKILKKYYGMNVGDLLEIHYDKGVLKDIIFYGLQASIFPFIHNFWNLWILFTYLDNVNAYYTWQALIGTGMGLAAQMGQFGDFSLRTSIAEAYPSKKITLSEFHISYSVRWRMCLMLMLAMIIIGASPFYMYAVGNLDAYKYYQGIQVLLIPAIIGRILGIFMDLPGHVLWGARKITQSHLFGVVGLALRVIFTYLTIIVWRVQETWGWIGLVYIFGFRDWIPNWIMTAILYIYINLRILKVRIYWKASALIPIISTLPAIALAQLFYNFGFFPALNWIASLLGVSPDSQVALLTTLVPMIFVFFLFVIYTFFPLMAMLGGFDDYSLFVFKKAVAISGPSKPIFKRILKMMNRGVKIARKLKLHGRWPIPYKEAHVEIRELLEIKRVDRERNLMEKKTGIRIERTERTKFD